MMSETIIEEASRAKRRMDSVCDRLGDMAHAHDCIGHETEAGLLFVAVNQLQEGADDLYKCFTKTLREQFEQSQQSTANVVGAAQICHNHPRGDKRA